MSTSHGKKDDGAEAQARGAHDGHGGPGPEDGKDVEVKDVKDVKDAHDARHAKDAKDAKDVKEAKGANDARDAKAGENAKDAGAAHEPRHEEPKGAPAAADIAEVRQFPSGHDKAPPRTAGADKGRVLVVAWGSEGGADLEQALGGAGFEVHLEGASRIGAFRWADEHRPVAVVIDLRRDPEEGKAVARTLGVTGSTAAIPRVLCSEGTDAQAIVRALEQRVRTA